MIQNQLPKKQKTVTTTTIKVFSKAINNQGNMIMKTAYNIAEEYDDKVIENDDRQRPTMHDVGFYLVSVSFIHTSGEQNRKSQIVEFRFLTDFAPHILDFSIVPIFSIFPNTKTKNKKGNTSRRRRWQS